MSIMLPDVVVDTVNSGQPVSLEVVAIVSLILFLAVREIGDASRSRRVKELSDYLMVAIVPLFIVFLLVVVWDDVISRL
jgi:uncharacterized membrane protein